MAVPLIFGQFEYSKMFMSLALVGVIGLLVRLYTALVANPRRLRSFMTKQGISGPPPSFLLGNIMEIKNSRTTKNAPELAVPAGESPAEHNCANLLFPFFEKWRRLYGMLINLQPIYIYMYLYTFL